MRADYKSLASVCSWRGKCFLFALNIMMLTNHTQERTFANSIKKCYYGFSNAKLILRWNGLQRAVSVFMLGFINLYLLKVYKICRLILLRWYTAREAFVVTWWWYVTRCVKYAQRTWTHVCDGLVLNARAEWEKK